jgi:hypothetical protein
VIKLPDVYHWSMSSSIATTSWIGPLPAGDEPRQWAFYESLGLADILDVSGGHDARVRPVRRLVQAISFSRWLTPGAYRQDAWLA